MKGRLSARMWVLVLLNAVALVGVLVLAYSAGARSGGLAIQDVGALGRTAGLELLGAAFVAVAITLILIFRLDAKAVKPVDELLLLTDRMASGDTEARATAESGDDFAVIGTNMNQVAEKLAGVRQVEEQSEAARRSVWEVAGVLTQFADGKMDARATTENPVTAELAASVNRILDRYSELMLRVGTAATTVAANANQILVASEDGANGAAQQNQELNRTSAALQQITAALRQVSGRLSSQAESAAQSFEGVDKASRAAAESAEGMQRVRAALQDAGTKIKAMNDRALEIYEVINVVNETNLLALHGAIEASRGSEAGRSLDILSAELTKLSEHSRAATRDVVALLKGIQGDTNRAVVALDQGQREVEIGLRVAEQGAKSIGTVTALVKQTVEVAAAVSDATRQQVQAMEGLGGSLAKMASFNRQTSQAAAQTAGAVAELVKLSEQMNDVITKRRTLLDEPAPAQVQTAAGGA